MPLFACHLRLLALPLLAGVMLLFAAACGGGGDDAAPTGTSQPAANGTAEAMKTPEPTLVIPRSPTKVSAYRAVTAAQFKPEDLTKPTLPVKDGTRIDKLENITFANDDRFPAVAFMLADESDVVAPFDGKIELRVTIPDTGKVNAGSFSYVVTNTKGEAVELWLPANSVLLVNQGAAVKRGQTIAKYSTGALGKDGGSWEMIMFFSRSTTDTPVPVTNEIWATGTPVIYIG